MGEMEYYRSALEKLTTVFSTSVVECIGAFFGKKSEVRNPWEVVDQLKSSFEFIVTIGSSNERHSALMFAGMQQEAFSAFSDIGDMTKEVAADILGEFVNNYSGMVTVKKEFSNEFGILTQAVPVLYTDGHSYLPFLWGVQGYVYVNGHAMYIGYSIRKNRNDREWGRT